MAVTSSSDALDTPDRSGSPAKRDLRTVPWMAAGGLLWLIAFAIRAWSIMTANDLFIDELTYTSLSVTVSRGQLANLDGVPFFLHPPGEFVTNALVFKLFGLTGSTMDLVYQLRWINVTLGAFVVLLVFLVARQIASDRAAMAAALLVALDPFALRNDGRVMLETPTICFLLTGLLIFLLVYGQASSKSSWMGTLIGGIFIGLAALSKDIAYVLAVPPLLAVVWRRTFPARSMLSAVIGAVLPYSVYLVVVTASGLLPQWWSAKISGVARLSGAKQISGFNAPNAPSLLDKLTEQSARFGTSYILIGLCVIVGLWAAWSATGARRVIGLVGLTAGAMGLYAAFFGTLEEQFGYYVVIAAVLASTALVAELSERRTELRRPVAVVASIFLAATVVLGVSSRLATDDGFRQARTWLAANVPAGAPVGLTGVTAEFALLPHTGYGVWPSLSSLDEHHADYVLTQSKQLSEGYGYAAPALLSWLKAHATPVFNAHGPSAGDTAVWRLDRAAVSQAVATGNTIPPIKGGYH
jgi:4-amino-4-deoxy-L-arabinose transferase-like glycosyltransferase